MRRILLNNTCMHLANSAVVHTYHRELARGNIHHRACVRAIQSHRAVLLYRGFAQANEQYSLAERVFYYCLRPPTTALQEYGCAQTWSLWLWYNPPSADVIVSPSLTASTA